jgi:hypothetical protein
MVANSVTNSTKVGLSVSLRREGQVLHKLINKAERKKMVWGRGPNTRISALLQSTIERLRLDLERLERVNLKRRDGMYRQCVENVCVIGIADQSEGMIEKGQGGQGSVSLHKTRGPDPLNLDQFFQCLKGSGH